MRRLHVSLLACSALALALALAATADAATLKLSCAGKGPRNKDSANTVLCAGGLKGRAISGTIRNDAGQPVAGKVTVTTQSWTPAKVGGGYNVKPIGTRDIVAKANGTFSFPTNPATKQSFHFDLQADPTQGIAAGVRADADVSRRLTTTVTKLGGGRVRLTVTGTTARPLKAYVLDATGNLIGIPGKNVDRQGRATFNLGSRRGKFTTYVDAGKLNDLFWAEARRPTFRL